MNIPHDSNLLNCISILGVSFHFIQVNNFKAKTASLEPRYKDERKRKKMALCKVVQFQREKL